MSVDAESEHNRVCCLLFVVVAVVVPSDIFPIAGSVGSS
jgi:hypothetical protein